MLEITIPRMEFLDEATSQFVVFPEVHLTLEHSLISISKWESKWKKPFFDKEPRTLEESHDYIRCMCIGKEPDEATLRNIPGSEMARVNAYIDDPMTATWFNDKNAPGGRPGGRGQAITSELIYYWMINYEVPPEYQKWHLNRLLTLIKICERKSQPGKKMKKKDIYAQNRALNEMNRAKYHSKG